VTGWDIDLPLARTRRGQVTPGPPLTANETRRMHWAVERKLIILVRNAAHYRALDAKIPRQQHVTIQLHYAPGSERGGRFDPSNLQPTAKAAIDGVRRAGVVDDDDAAHVTELMPVIHHGPGVRRLWLHIQSTEEQP
jgi:crossover junction endodeoxyribonuclease RusA